MPIWVIAAGVVIGYLLLSKSADVEAGVAPSPVAIPPKKSAPGSYPKITMEKLSMLMLQHMKENPTTVFTSWEQVGPNVKVTSAYLDGNGDISTTADVRKL